MATGSEFQQVEPEKDRLVLYRSMRGLGNTYLLVRLLLSEKREIMYEGVILLFTLNISTALLKYSCFCNGSMLRAFIFSSVDEFLSESSSLAARR